LHLQIFPLHRPIFPLHLVESRILSPLAYINSATPLTHEVGKREAAFISRPTQLPSALRGGTLGYETWPTPHLCRHLLCRHQMIPPLQERATCCKPSREVKRGACSGSTQRERNLQRRFLRRTYSKAAKVFPFDPFRSILGKALTQYSLVLGMGVSGGRGLHCATIRFTSC
jgi:hypothetical protein